MPDQPQREYRTSDVADLYVSSAFKHWLYVNRIDVPEHIDVAYFLRHVHITIYEHFELHVQRDEQPLLQPDQLHEREHALLRERLLDSVPTTNTPRKHRELIYGQAGGSLCWCEVGADHFGGV